MIPMHLIPDVAKELQISPATLRQYINAGYVEALKIGRQWFITQKEFDRIKTRYGVGKIIKEKI